MSNISSDVIEGIIDAAIDWDVRWGTRTMNFIKQGGVYVSENPATGGRIIFPARGGSLDGLQESTGTTLVTAEEYQLDGQTAAACYKKWEDRVYQLSYRFKTFPIAADFTGPVGRFEPLLAILAVNPELVRTSDSAGQDSLDFDVTGNDQFTLIGSAAENFATYQGETSDAFRKYYLGRFPLIVQRQYGVAQMLEIAVKGEQTIWERQNADGETLFTEMRTAFERQGAAPPGPIDFTVFGALVGLVAAIPGVNAVVAAGAGLAGAITGVLSLFPVPETDPPQFELVAETADGLWSKVEEAVEGLNKGVRDQEKAIADHMMTIRNMIVSDPGSWDLGRIDDGDGDGRSASDELQDETSASNVIGVTINFQIARNTGGDLKTVAMEFKAAAGYIDGLMESGAWSRPGDFGMGFIGHFEETNALAEELYAIVHGTDLGLQRGGDIIIIAANELERQDGDVNSDLRKNVSDLDTMDASQLPR